MRNIITKLSLLLIGILIGFSNQVFASDAYYGAQKKVETNSASNSGRRTSFVTLTNNTPDTYMAYATFQSSGKQIPMPLGRVNTPSSVIIYRIEYPDYAVCLNVVRDFDQALVYQGCLSSNNVNIGVPYLSNKTPQVRVTPN